MQRTRNTEGRRRLSIAPAGLALALGLAGGATSVAQSPPPPARPPAPPAAAPRADEARPKIVHVRPGFSFQTRLGFWNPMLVDVENPGPATNVYIRVESAGERSSQALSTGRDVALPPRSRTSAYLPVFPDRAAATGDKITEYADVTLGDGAAATWSTLSVMGPILAEDRPLHLVVEAEGRSYNIVKKRIAGGRETESTRSAVMPRGLPARAGDLAAMDVVILGALGGHTLDAFQAGALRSWVEAGGVLAVVPGAGFDAADLGPLEPLLPVAYGAPAVVETVPFVGGGADGEFRAPKGILARPMTLRAGRARLGPPEAPAVAERPVGEGRVVAFAFDVGDEAFQHWPSASAFWSRHTPLPPPSIRYAARRLADRAVLPPLVQELAGIEVMSRRQVRTYLAAVAALVLVPILLGHGVRRPAAGWIAALALAAGAGLAAVRAGRPPADATSPQLIEVYQARGRSGAAGFAVQSAFGLYAPLGGAFRVRGTDERALPRPGIEYATPPERFDAVWTDRLEAPALLVRPRAVRAFAVEAAAPGAAPEAELVYGPEGAQVRVRHPGPGPLEDAFLRAGRLVIPVGDLAPGEERVLPAVRPDAPRDEMVYSARAVRRLRDLARVRLFAAIYPPFEPDPAAGGVPAAGRGAAEGEWDAPALGAWSDAPRAPLAPTEPAAGRRALGFVRVAATVRHGGPDGRALYPRGALPARAERRAPALRVHPDGFYSGYQADTFTLVFTLPDDAPGLAPDGLRVFRSLASDDYELAVRLHPADGGPPREIPAGAVVDVGRPADFYDPASRTVRLTAEVRRRPGAADRSWARPWIVRDLDIELAGRVADAPAGERQP